MPLVALVLGGLLVGDDLVDAEEDLRGAPGKKVYLIKLDRRAYCLSRGIMSASCLGWENGISVIWWPMSFV